MTTLPVLGSISPAKTPASIPATLAAAIARDLANRVEGEVRFGLHDRMLYATDASLYQVEPLGVVIPASVEDAVRAVRFCHERRLPILPRGGGTSLAGQCTNHAVVIDLSPNCRRIIEVNAVEKWARVEPGITVDDLNDELTKMGGAAGSLFFAPDPATSRHANVGGCIGNNAAGARSILFGRTSESLLGVDACLADGTRLRFERGGALHDERLAAITRRVLETIFPLEAQIRERFPKTVRRNAGYALDMILEQAWPKGSPRPSIEEAMARVNLAHLLCGSEGTLALTLGAQLKLHDKPKAKGLAVLGFSSLDESIDAVVPILSTGPSAVELLDDTVVDLARANTEYSRYVDLMPAPKRGILKAVLYVEFFANSPDEIREKFARLARVVEGLNHHSALQFHTDAGAMLKAWKLRKAGEPLLHGIPGHRKPITFVEDNAVPVERLSEFVKRFRAIVEKHGTRAAYYAHASVGVLHVRPLIDLHDERDREIMRSIAVEVADLAKSLGGVMSGEHGDGRVRGPLLERFFGPEITRAFREVKAIFDPSGLLNPGNIVPTEGEPRPIESITQRLRLEPEPKRPVPVPEVDTYFSYDDQHGFDSAVEMCNGAGVCRKKQGGTMCPSYMGTLDERHSTRGRGNALRLAITGQFARGSEGEPTLLAPSWDDADTIETLDLCLSCKACKTECPSNVDIARLKAEYTAQRYRERPPTFATRLMGNVRVLNRMGALAAGLSNWGSSLAPVRAIINRVMGFHPERTLPRFASSLASRWSRSKVDATARVVLFGDCFTMFNEPGIGLATKRVFEACGYRVDLADAGCCARAKISLGLLPEAIEEIDATLERLRPLIDDASVKAILVAEPSCLSAFKDDWLTLKVRTPIEIRKRLAAKAFLPEDFLDKSWDAHPLRPAFRPAGSGDRVILHGHCHQKALWGAETSANALKRTGVPVETLDTGCCGMAGGFGYSADRYDLSIKIANLSLVPAIRKHAGATLAATGTSCRHQAHDAANAHAKHPIEIIAERLA